MISVSDALQQVLDFPIEKNIVLYPLDSCMDKILAQDIIAPFPLPHFSQSAMDGYALPNLDFDQYQVIGILQAGHDTEPPELDEKECMRVFTGSPIPPNTYKVIIQEHVERNKDLISIPPKMNSKTNIRPVGEQLKKGDRVFEVGHQINPATIGMLATMGYEEVAVFIPPDVGLVTTGNEMIATNEKITSGKIYNSNAPMLKAVLQKTGIKFISCYHTEDYLEQTLSTLVNALEENDVLIITGGISVGDYDFIREALNQIGVKEIFYKVNQKPGKPLLFGHLGLKPIFALPGNPASSLTCFYIYILPFIKKILGHSSLIDQRIGISTENIENRSGKTLFLKGYIDKNNRVKVLSHQQSSMLSSLAKANALIHIPEDTPNIKADSEVEYYPINTSGIGL